VIRENGTSAGQAGGCAWGFRILISVASPISRIANAANPQTVSVGTVVTCWVMVFGSAAASRMATKNEVFRGSGQLL
jgi:hypothetical protein